MRLAFFALFGASSCDDSASARGVRSSSSARPSSVRVPREGRVEVAVAEGLRAAVLVTDERTRPLEFRLTEPLHVGSLQATLHGAAFSEQVLGELLACPLLRSLREKPDWVLVADDDLLVLEDSLAAGAGTPRPLLWIGRDPNAATAGDRPGSGTVLGFRDGAEGAQNAREALRGIATRYDLLEPFVRIGQAVRQLDERAATVGALEDVEREAR
jgi:hypothetical protein